MSDFDDEEDMTEWNVYFREGQVSQIVARCFTSDATGLNFWDDAPFGRQVAWLNLTDVRAVIPTIALPESAEAEAAP